MRLFGGQLFNSGRGIQLFQVPEGLLQLVQQPAFPAEVLRGARFWGRVETKQYGGFGVLQQVVKQHWVIGFVFQGNQPQAGFREFRVALQAIRVSGKANVQAEPGRGFLQAMTLQDDIRDDTDRWPSWLAGHH